MNLRTFLILLVGCSLAGIAYAAASSPGNHDADTINRWFADILLIIKNLQGLIEPLVGLAIAVILAQNFIQLKRQKAAMAERAVQTQAIATIQTAVAPEAPPVVVPATKPVLSGLGAKLPDPPKET